MALQVQLVLSGGGVNGLAMVGAVAALEKLGVRPVRYAGTSSGAMVAALLASGYESSALERILSQICVRRMLGIQVGMLWRGKQWWKLIRGEGWIDGKRMEQWMRMMLLAKRVRTFADLPKHTLHIVATNLTTQQMVVLPDDCDEDMDIAKAVRMSASIPFVFDPVAYRGSYYVDGFILSNTPLLALQTMDGVGNLPVVVLTFGESEPNSSVRWDAQKKSDQFNRRQQMPASMGGIFGTIHALFGTMIAAHDRYWMERHPEIIHLRLPTNGIKPTDFFIKPDEMKKLMNSGAEAAVQQWMQKTSV